MRISTPNGHGTGFLFAQSADLWGIATAAHVIRHEHAWEEIIRLEHLESGNRLVLHQGERAIIMKKNADAAAIVIEKATIPFPQTLLPIIDPTLFAGVGVEVGWLGYPGLGTMTDQLCFFSGRVSCWLDRQSTYLVDGVAIHGVSGGPAFDREDGEILGIVTAYIPNLVRGQTLPGVSSVLDIAELQTVVQAFRDLDQARAEQTPPAASAAESQAQSQASEGQSET